MNLFYKKYGESGEVIFILHGIFGMLDNWHNIAKSLSEHYTVYTIDARNHGKSPHSDAMGYDLMADDVISLADTLNLDAFILMGHSMGGKTAMRVALKYPQRISKLIIVDIAPKAYSPGHTPYFKAFEELPWEKFHSRKEIDEALIPYESDAGVRLFLAKNIERNETGGFTVKSNINAIKNAYSEITGAYPLSGIYEGKVCFISGEKSRYLLESDKIIIEAHFPNSIYKEIPNSGHWVHADNPYDFLKELQLFLA